ncbi:MAG: GatB/YqeY domain-containing protein [Planctomycetota bacterium]
MSRVEQLQTDMKTAMKAKEAERLGVIRMLLSAIKNAQIEKGKEPMTDEEVVAVIQRAVKQRRESADMYRQGQREELAAKEEREIEVLEAYLPKQLSDAELEAAVDRVLQDLGVTDPKDFGRVMKEIMAEFKGQVDGKRVQGVIRARLSG